LTVMFSDLVGSTALSRRLDPEARRPASGSAEIESRSEAGASSGNEGPVRAPAATRTETRNQSRSPRLRRAESSRFLGLEREVREKNCRGCGSAHFRVNVERTT